jgi:hypothetical protein
MLITPAPTLAHRLDEYLQAARISLERDRITVDMDLTAGARIASDVIALIDRDRDGTISPHEARAYGQQVLSEIVLRIDDRPVALTLSRVEASSIGELREGMGVIQLTAGGGIDTVVAGRREVYFQNNHHPDQSVYLVNALVPQTRGIRVVRQVRDTQQHAARIDYDVQPQSLVRVLWLVCGAAGLAAATLARRTRR